MNLYRYNITNPDGRTITVVAKSTAQAKGKAWVRFIAGVPFLQYGPKHLLVERLEKVDGPALIEVRQSFPEYLKGG